MVVELVVLPKLLENAPISGAEGTTAPVVSLEIAETWFGVSSGVLILLSLLLTLPLSLLYLWILPEFGLQKIIF